MASMRGGRWPAWWGIVVLAGLAQACSGSSTGRPLAERADQGAPWPDAARADRGSAAADLAADGRGGACAHLTGEGDRQGQVAADWTLSDGRGTKTSLHGLCGQVILFEASSEW